MSFNDISPEFAPQHPNGAVHGSFVFLPGSFYGTPVGGSWVLARDVESLTLDRDFPATRVHLRGGTTQGWSVALPPERIAELVQQAVTINPHHGGPSVVAAFPHKDGHGIVLVRADGSVSDVPWPRREA